MDEAKLKKMRLVAQTGLDAPPDVVLELLDHIDALKAGVPRVYVICDGSPGPEPGRFVEVEDEAGRSLGPVQTGAKWELSPHGGGRFWRLGPFHPGAPAPAPAATEPSEPVKV